MILSSNIKSTFFSFFHSSFLIVWLANLAHTDSYFSIYVIIAFSSFYLHFRHLNAETRLSRRDLILTVVLSVVFSALVLIANYELFTQIRDPAFVGSSTNLMINLINICFSFIGGICTFYPIVKHLLLNYPTNVNSVMFSSSKYFPFLVFGSFVFIQLVHLFFGEYPGNVTQDPFAQISEMVSGHYSNFNTFWHTRLFQMILSIGYFISTDVNFSISLFCVVQAITVSFAFTYSLMTMVRYGIPKLICFISYLIFAVVPYNIALPITIWKDVLFAAGCLLFVSSWLRLLMNLDGNKILNYCVFIFGSVLLIMSRTNGWLIYLVSFVVFLFSGKWNKTVLAVMGSVALLGWFLLNPVLAMMNIPGSDLVESLSIPVQQVSRVIADGCDLQNEEEELLSRVVDLEEVPILYTNWLSDPMKVEIRSKDYDYFQDHFDDYADLWVKLGIRYPDKYLKAWIDQTKGYWNGGYDYALYSETVTDNPYGVEKASNQNIIATFFRLYFGLSRHVIFFEPLHSIGLHVWIILLCFILNLRHRRAMYVLFVPFLTLLLGLWLGTPVYCSFRYVYPLFVSFPLLVSVSLYSRQTT